MTLKNGVGTYKFARDPEVAINGTVTETPTGWSLSGMTGLGATLKLEQDKTGVAVGRAALPSGGLEIWNLGCVGPLT